MGLVIGVAAQVTESKQRRKLMKTLIIYPFCMEFFTGYFEFEVGFEEKSEKKC